MEGLAIGARASRLVLPRVGGSLITGVMRTTRLELIDGADYEQQIMVGRVPAVYVLWHGRLLPCAYMYRDRGLGTLISRNRDGDYITQMIAGWGYQVIRGSSSRGGSTALREIVRALRGGMSVALTPDGPRGPRQKMKLGPLQAAQKAGVPIVPVTAGARSAWYFGRWDRFLVPKPFTWIPVVFGAPIYVEPDATEDELESQATQIEDKLNELTVLVDEAAAGKPLG